MANMAYWKMTKGPDKVGITFTQGGETKDVGGVELTQEASLIHWLMFSPEGALPMDWVEADNWAGFVQPAAMERN